MLQYAVPNAPQPFQRRPSVFADPPRPQSAASQHHDNENNGYNIPRPPSTISVHSVNHPRHSITGGGSDISLATLASLAASAPAAIVHNTTNTTQNSGDSTRSSTPNSNGAMSQSAPAATAGYGNQNGSAPPICANCQTSTTPLWRRDESGSVLCNACGLFLKLHGRPRPISLKTDVIKSRNRVKASQTKKRDSQGGENGLSHIGNGYATAHGDVAHLQHASHQHSLPMGSGMSHERAASPNSMARSQTPGLHSQHSNPNIAPQHIFDTVSLPSDTFASPSIPHAQFPSHQQRQPSPPQNGTNNGHASSAMLQQENETLRTRVSELEVINDLFRGRVSELEEHEQQYRQRESAREEEAQRLTAELVEANARSAKLQRTLEQMQQSNGEEKEEEGPARKRARIGTDSESGSHTTSEVDSAKAVDDGTGTLS